MPYTGSLIEPIKCAIKVYYIGFKTKACTDNALLNVVIVCVFSAVADRWRQCLLVPLLVWRALRLMLCFRRLLKSWRRYES